MAITSENNRPRIRFYASNQIRYSLLYICITLAALLFLNVYSSGTSQKLYYQNKEIAMLEKCQLVSDKIAEQSVLNSTTATNVINQLGSLRVSRLIITDHTGKCLYDSQVLDSSLGQYVLFPEIVVAMEGNDVFSWRFQNGVMLSRAAMPITSYGVRIG